MAKHCDVCNRDYADDQPACPHCADAKKTQLTSRAADRATHLADGHPPPTPSDSAINLGQTPAAPGTGDAAGAEPAPISGASTVAWSTLVEEPVDEIKIDSPSDADLLQHGQTDHAPSDEERVGELRAEQPHAPVPAAHGAGDDAVELSATPPKPSSSLSDSSVDLGASSVEIVEEGSGAVVEAAPASDSQVFVAELASDASKVDLVGDSGVNLAEAVEAGIDPNTPEAELNEQVALDAVVVEEHSSAVDLGATPEAGVEAISAVEGVEIAEAGDGSGIDLEGVPASGDSAPRSVSESSVDLGSQAEIAPLSASGQALESLLSESSSGIRPTEEEAALVQEEAAAGGESTVSETEVDQLLASLDEAPAGEAAEEEEAVAAAEEEVAAEPEEKPSKPVKQRSRIPALAGGAFLGLLVGAGGLIGARVGGFDVPAMMGLGEKEKPPSRPTGPQTQAPTAEARAALLRNGDWEEAAKAGIEQIQETNPNELAARGSYRLGVYLHKTGAKVNLQDPALQLAIKDLKTAAEAKNADAIYDLGLINEVANKPNEARAEYTKGLNAFLNDPVQKKRFQSALDRVEAMASGQAAGAFLVPMPQRRDDRATLLALLLIALQQQPVPQPVQPGGQPPAPAKAGEDEAGFDFWEAAKLARKRDFDKAIRALDKARKLHDQRRFTRLRKAQNPLSDPTEIIFLRCCDELKQYWLMESQLRERNYLTDKNTPQEAFQNLAIAADASAKTIKEVADTLKKAKIIADAARLSKGVDEMLAAKEAAEKKADDATKKLDAAVKDAKESTAKLKTAEEALKDRDAKLKVAVEQETKLKTANESLNATLKKITDELESAKLLDPNGKPDVGDAVKKAVDLAKIKDPSGLIRQQRGELDQLLASLKQRWRPEEMMPLWLLLLEQNRDRGELANQATVDVARVNTDPAATPARKGQAQVVLGLALRNGEKFAEAKTVLLSARRSVDQGEWLMRADAALREVSDPAAYFAAQARDLYDRGRMNTALAVLDRALKTLPEKDRGKLFAQRSLIELDAACSKGRGTLSPSEPLLIAARKDAAEAVKAGLSEGHYAAGRIAEELGQWDAAIASYRKALAAHPALDADGGRYRVALARVLLQPRAARPGPAAPMPPAGGKLGWRDPALTPGSSRSRLAQDAKWLAAMIVLGLQAPGLPDEDAALLEAERLADQVLSAPADQVPFNVRAQALAIKGRWTLALQMYIEGVRPMLPREYGNGLLYLILNHPRLKRPDSLRIPNPAEAEKHYAAGLNFYFDRDYANAEREFLLTVENDSQDARYFYFLGLSRLALNKRRDAVADFDEGAMLERLNRPSPAAVSESLERIQGPTRRIVNDIRNRPEH